MCTQGVTPKSFAHQGPVDQTSLWWPPSVCLKDVPSKKRLKPFTSYAGDKGLKWVKGKTYREVWDTLDNPCWLLWLVTLTLELVEREGFHYDKAYEAAKAANGGLFVSVWSVKYSSATGRVMEIHSDNSFGYGIVCDAIRGSTARPRLLGL